jgi:putative heme-binding domain-containing protein
VAVKQGNALRGKKIFYESASACYACHDPPGGVARLGPDLPRLRTKLTNEQLVDSLLRPAALIEKDFAQVSVLTLDGQIFTGIRVSENDDEIVLRNLAMPKPLTIAQDDIEQVKDSKVSLMPANLVRQLKNREEFNDLMKYIIEVRRR